MSDDTLPDNERTWDEGDTPNIQVTLLDGAGVVIPLSNVTTLTLTQWVEFVYPGRPGVTPKSINSRNLQNALNANNVTVATSSGLVTWQLQTADTAMQSRDLTIREEKHHFRFDVTYTVNAVVYAKSYPDYFVVQRKTVVKT